jgi:hypothetical protein
VTAVPTINTELTLLLQIQDIRAKIKELQGESGLGVLEQKHFGIDPDEAAAQLEEHVAELEGQLSAPIRSRYGLIAGHLDRVVVPVIAGTCYGCFVSIPTATASEEAPNASLQVCEHCGRFLYILS